jgi:hypothetical protein
LLKKLVFKLIHNKNYKFVFKIQLEDLLFSQKIRLCLWLK